VVLVRRGRRLRDHGGEVGFPGGGWEPGDGSPVETALREAAEEIGLDPTESIRWRCFLGY
jgi:8-oxo-dGTP pyrophosphatase MutT (NUDIX family)